MPDLPDTRTLAIGLLVKMRKEHPGGYLLVDVIQAVYDTWPEVADLPQGVLRLKVVDIYIAMLMIDGIKPLKANTIALDQLRNLK